MSDQDYAIRPNKSQLKREIRALNDLGKELAALPLSTLKKIPLSKEMLEAVEDAKRFQRGALQRQLRRIANLMRHEDIDAIRLELTRLKNPSKQQTAEFHMLEEWRDRLISGDQDLLTELIGYYPEIDRQLINQLVRNAKLEIKREKPPKSSRKLFKYLSEMKQNHRSESESSSLAQNDSEMNS